MSKLDRIGSVEAIAFILIVIINRIILNTPKSIIDSTGSSGWINVIYITVIAILFLLLIGKLFKNFPNSDIIDISEFVGGKVLKIIIGIVYFVLFLLIGSIMLRDFADALQIIYFQTSPIIYIMLFFLIGIVITNMLGFKAISRINLIIVPFLLFSILIIFFSTFKYFYIERLTPILGNGINATFLSGVTNIFAFSGIVYLYFLMPFLKNKQDYKKISLISIIISSIYLFLSVASLLLLFTYTLESKEIISIYLVTRLIEYGRFFQRVDALFVFLWILSFLSYLSITMFFVQYCYQKITSIKHSNAMVYSFAAIMLGIALIPQNILEVKFMENTFFKYYILILAFIITPILLIIANIKYKKKYKIPPNTS